MLLTKKFIAAAVSGIVSPHGMTDYIHAKKFGYLQQLYKINLGIVSSGIVLNQFQLQHFVHYAFIVSSIIHFRNDMPSIPYKYNKSIQLMFSTIFVTSMHFVPPEYFVLYMLFIHTPNHYRIAWSYIKDNLEETLVLVLGIGFILSQLNFIENTPAVFLNVIQTLVISHIVYQEKYVFQEYQQLVNNIKQKLIK